MFSDFLKSVRSDLDGLLKEDSLSEIEVIKNDMIRGSELINFSSSLRARIK
jgi:hypothetical protein